MLLVLGKTFVTQISGFLNVLRIEGGASTIWENTLQTLWAQPWQFTAMIRVQYGTEYILPRCGK